MSDRWPLIFCIFSLISSLSAQELNPGFSARRILDGLNPVAMAVDHHHRIWQVEKDGKVLIIEEDGTLSPDPFITIRVDDFNERGLLGIALHPDMDRQPYVYLYYTVPGGNHNRVSRFLANGDLAVPGSEEILLDLDPLSGAIHNGGAMLFDRAGHLFIATGEAGKASNSQDTSNLLGKILRIKADGGIPEDNPFYQTLTGKNRAIWSMGHRNPFNLTYDWMEDRLYATDVGGGTFEEINLIEKGKNYGWPIIEGPIVDQIAPQNYQDPYYAYAYDVGSACAIVGLAIYRPKVLSFGSQYDGALFFADYCGGTISYLEQGDPNQVRSFAKELNRPLNVLLDHENGNLFFHTRAGQGGGSPDDNTASDNGALWQLFYKGNGKPEIVNKLPELIRVIGEDAFYEITALGTEPITYQWLLNGEIVDQENSSQLALPSLDPPYNNAMITCIVSNDEGRDTSNTASLRVLNNNRPKVTISSPKDGELFRAGDSIVFAGFAEDVENGRLNPSSLSWKLDFHHNDHTHPLISLEEIATGAVVIPTNGETSENVWIRMHLSASDLDGLENTTFIEMFPEFSTITFTSEQRATISIDGAPRILPVTINSMIGLHRSIEIPDVQYNGSQLLLYNQWLDGYNEPIRNIQTRASPDTFFIAFEEVSLGNGTGLSAEYWNGENTPDDGVAPDLTRIDTVIDFGWDNKSPDEDVIDRDFFFGRWSGFIEAPFSESYTLSIASDDGARMWIDDELIFEHWHPQATTEHFFTYTFEAQKKYPIRIEYFERDGGAAIHLRWQSEHTQREIIPRRQLYPLETGMLEGVLWLDREVDQKFDGNEETIPNAAVILLDQTYHLVSFTETSQDGYFNFEAVPGEYHLHVVLPEGYRQWIPNSGLDAFGYSPRTPILPDSTQFIAMGFVDQMLTSVQVEVENLVKISPNPSISFLDVDSKSHIKNLSVFDTDGVLQIQRVGNQSYLIRLDISDLNLGPYVLAIHTDTGLIFRKFLKL